MKTISPALQLAQSLLHERHPNVADRESGRPDVVVNGIHVPVRLLPFSMVPEHIEAFAERSNRDLFDGKLPSCRIAWNTRFRSLGGRIDCKRRRIELSLPHLEASGVLALSIVVVHEQIHLALHTAGLPFGHTANFKAISHELGLPSIHHAMPLPERLTRRRKIHLYQCPNGHQLHTLRHFHQPRACGKCCRAYNGGKFSLQFLLDYKHTETAAQYQERTQKARQEPGST